MHPWPIDPVETETHENKHRSGQCDAICENAAARASAQEQKECAGGCERGAAIPTKMTTLYPSCALQLEYAICDLPINCISTPTTAAPISSRARIGRRVARHNAAPAPLPSVQPRPGRTSRRSAKARPAVGPG